MKLFTNGFPKTGNHALVKAAELLGVPCTVNHRAWEEGVPEGTTHSMLIVRDPRNVVISMLRFNRQPVTGGTFLARFRHFQYASMAEEMAKFEPWLRASHVVRYEDLIRDDQAMRRMAGYLGVPYLEGSWSELPGLTFTWNERHSDYRAIWNPHLEEVWAREGGNELMKRWGY